MARSVAPRPVWPTSARLVVAATTTVLLVVIGCLIAGVSTHPASPGSGAPAPVGVDGPESDAAVVPDPVARTAAADVEFAESRQARGGGGHGSVAVPAEETSVADGQGRERTGTRPVHVTAMAAWAVAGGVAAAAVAWLTRRRDVEDRDFDRWCVLLETDPVAAMAATRARLDDSRARAVYVTAAEATRQHRHVVAAGHLDPVFDAAVRNAVRELPGGARSDGHS